MTAYEIALLCNLLLQGYTVHNEDTVAFDLCVQVAEAGAENGVPEELAVAVAYFESRYDPDAVSSAGARGLVQIIPRYHCFVRDPVTLERVRDGDGERVAIPPEDCNLLLQGMLALRSYHLERDDWWWALARYAGGRSPGSRARRYADRVLAMADVLRADVEVSSEPEPVIVVVREGTYVGFLDLDIAAGEEFQ